MLILITNLRKQNNHFRAREIVVLFKVLYAPPYGSTSNKAQIDGDFRSSVAAIRLQCQILPHSFAMRKIFHRSRNGISNLCVFTRPHPFKIGKVA